MNKKAVGGAFVAIFCVLASLALYFTVGGPQVAAATCDTGSLRIMAESAASDGNDAVARSLKQDIQACEGIEVDGFADFRYPLTAPPAAPQGRTHEFLANRPVNEKVAANAFGTQVALMDSIKGKDMDSLTADEAWGEHQFVLKLDPMQTSAAGNTLGFIPGSEVDAKTKLFASDYKAWDDMNDRVITRLGEMTREVRRIPAGTPVKMQYAFPGLPIPLVLMDEDVVFNYDIYVLVYKDKNGKEYRFRLKCKFQSLDMIGVPLMPKASKPLIRTPEGTPEKPSSSTPPVTTTTDQTTTTPPVTTTTTTPPCGEGGPCESKTSAPQPPGVESPTGNPVGTVQPTRPTQPNPLEPTGGQPTQPTRSTAPPAVSTPTSATATSSVP